MKKHIIAAIAAFAVFGAFSTTANAAWTADSADINIAFDLTAKTSQAPTGTVAYTEATNLPLGGKVIFRLTNGATFVGAATAVAAGAAVIGQLGVSTGTAVATFTVTTAGVGGIVTLTTTNINLSAVPANGLVDITYETRDSLGNIITGPTSLDANTGIPGTPLFTMVPSIVVGTLTAQTDQALVASGFKVFVGGTVGTPQNGTATVLTLNSGGATTPLATANDNALITLTGDFTGIGSVSGAGFTGSTAAGSTAGGSLGFFSIDRTVVPNKAYAVTTTNIGAGLALAPVFVWDAVTPQPARSFTVTVDGIAGGAPTLTYPFNVQAATTIYTTTRNGATFTSDNISPSSVIRIADNNATSTVAGAIIVSAWDAAGAAVTQVGATLPTSVLGGHTVTIAKGVLKAAFPTAVRFNINVEASNVSVTHFKSNAAGLNVTVGSVGNAGIPQL